MATGDAVAMFETARSMIDRGTLDVPASQSSELWRGDRRPLLHAVRHRPVALRCAVSPRRPRGGRVTGISLGDPDTLPKAFVAAASTIPSAVAVGFALLIAWRLSSDVRSSVLTALVLAFGTMMWPYAKFGFNAALTTAALTAGVYGVAAGPRIDALWTVAAGGAGLGAALLTRHEMVIAAAIVALSWLVWQIRRDELALASHYRGRRDPVCVALVLWMTLNAVRFGNLWHTGHEPAFAPEGFRAFLVSPSGALLSTPRPPWQVSRSFFWRAQATRSAAFSWRFPWRCSSSMRRSRTGLARVRTGRGTLFRSARCSWLRSRPGSRGTHGAQFTSRWPHCVITGVARAGAGHRGRFLARGHRGRASRRNPSAVTSGDGRPSLVNARASLPAARSSLQPPLGWHAGGADRRAGGGSFSSGCRLGSTSGGCICSISAFFRGPRHLARAFCRSSAAWLLRRCLAAAAAVDRGIERSGFGG